MHYFFFPPNACAALVSIHKAGNDAHLWSVFRVAGKKPNKSCLILVSQKPLQCKGEKDTAGGNQNRD